jgi:hypothetical protein
MKIYSIVDWEVPCTFATMGWGVEGLSNYLNCEIKIYSYDELKQRKIDIDTSNDAMLVFEIGNPQHAGLNTQHLRQWFPNGKLIALCGDTQYYQFNNLQPQIDPNGIDLHLELTLSGVEWLQSKGAKVDWWKWGISEKLIDFAVNYKHALLKTREFCKENKTIDFIGVYHPCTLQNQEGWRYNAVTFLQKNGYTFTNGGGDGHYDKDFYRLFNHYISSWFTLGTTSHNRPEITRNQSAKFFRDELGPMLDSLLIYNECELTKRTFGSDIVPYYDYDNNQTIIDLYKKLFETEKYYELLDKQKSWVIENSFERLLIRKLVEHKIIVKDELKVNIVCI